MTSYKINKDTGLDFKTISEVSSSVLNVGDIITNETSILWDDVVDEEGNKISTFKGTIQHKLIYGNLWMTIMDLDGKRYKGKSVRDGENFIFTVEEIE
jgi:formylmethanofuran dehydrogenase subunit E-like metal-binding protein